MRAVVAALALVIAIGLAFASAADGFLPALNQRLPTLAWVPPRLAPAQPPLARRVVLVVADGLRFDTSRTLPGLAALRSRGAGVRARSTFPTISKANYVTLLAGVLPRFSGARTNDGFRSVALDSLFDRVRDAGASSGYVADRTRGIARLFDLADAVIARWDDGLEAAFASALARHRFVELTFLTIDVTGHAHGGESAAYRDAARSVDGWLARMLTHVDFSRDAVMVVADHGHTARGGHGGLGPDVEDVPLVLAGAGVRPGATVDGASLVDVAPTLAALLGVPPPGHGSGRTLIELLDLPPHRRAALIAADERRAAALAPVLRAIERADDGHRRRTRAWRTPLAAVALLGLAAALALAARRRLRSLDARALAASATFAVTFHALVFGFDRLRGSPSVPNSHSSLWTGLLVYAAVAAAAQLVAWSAALRRCPDRPARAASLLLAGLAVTVAPAILAWALVGLPLATTVPGPVRIIVTPFSYAAVAYYAAACVLGVALGAAHAALRRRPPLATAAASSTP